MKNLSLPILLVAGSLLSPLKAQASCADYPYTADQSLVEVVPGGVKIVQTAKANVTVDDETYEEFAREEATLKAKTDIAAFIKTELAKTAALDTEAIAKKVVNEQGTQYDMNNTKALLKSYSENVQQTMRGVIKLGSCYTPGEYVLVTVGLKPETVQASGNMEAMMGRQYSGSINQGKSGSASGNSVGAAGSSGTGAKVRGYSPYKSVPGYSGVNTDF